MGTETNWKLGLSADCSGVFGRPDLWKELWNGPLESSGLKPRFAGIEFFGWFGTEWTDSLISKARTERMPLIGYHALTGGIHDAYSWINRVEMLGLNEIMVPTAVAMLKYGMEVPYILIHSPEARRMKVRKLLGTSSEKLVKFIYTENHLHIGADGTALSVAREFKDLGYESGVMFDLKHDWDGLSHVRMVSVRAERVAKNLRWVLEEALRGGIDKVGVHVPMGRNGDSLSRDVWYEILPRVGELINSPEMREVIDVVIIEDQQRFPEVIAVPWWKVEEIKAWNTRVLSVVAETL